MIPAVFVSLPELPHTANGKVDVRALAAMEWTGAGHGAQAPPVTDLEREIAAVWSEVLRVESVGLYDNFFDLGGHSMLMVQAHTRLRGIVGELPLIKLLEHPTVSALAAYLSGGTSSKTFVDSQERGRKQRDSRRRHRTHGGRAGV
jgi:aryl carrier-like protein